MNSYTLLLVDDEKEFIDTLALRLRQRGATVHCALSGHEALRLLEENNAIDIIVLDIGMPHPDGLTVLRQIKEKTPLVEVIMLTGEATVRSAVAALQLGAFDYLLKPCALQDLISRVERSFSRRKKRQARILDARMKPYISEEERAQLIADILAE